MNITHPEALKPRKTPVQARSEATVDAIFKATIQVLLSDGERRLTTTRVAERAGVSVGTMYQYFPHKQALLYAVVQQHLTEFVEGFEVVCAQIENKPLATIAEAMTEAFVEIKTRQPDVSRALYKIAASLDTEELRVNVSRRLQAACSRALASATDARFDALPDIAFTLLTAMNGTTRAVFELGAEARLVELLRTHMQILCRGYLEAAASNRQ